MKSLERRFNNITEKNPYWSSYVCFYEAVKKQNLSKQTIHRWFQKLVNKDDYARSERRDVLAHLVNSSDPLRATGIRDKSAPETTK